ncbi:peptidoglycan DD-metalloendopeptidase family protein [Porcipelethomonas sp.]|uniref:peptidoglycan DD-metalloendopeptidase family protein n=1 Tax=Porcipelethomonas sp. TaxID=2981675 RepID=UPI003EFAA7F7
MKKNSKSILSGKGFYIALALSIAMVGAACYFAYTQTAENISGQLESSLNMTESENDNKDVAGVRTDIPKPATEAPVIAETTETTVITTAEETEDQEEDAEETAQPEIRKLIMPLEGEILNEFSNGELVKSNTTGAWQTHNGIDIEAALGDVVVASDSGTVSAVDEDPLWGITVTIDHGNGIITKYCNLNSGVTVQAGQQVSSGEEIGAVGETADIETSEKSHLHFEVYKNGSFTDPLSMM